ncbi:MAG: SpoIIE family protein phosphatase [Leptospirales bacterium]|nr:SpoIIE family protein phosphatase [Leptospirales bacterium]
MNSLGTQLQSAASIRRAPNALPAAPRRRLTRSIALLFTLLTILDLTALAIMQTRFDSPGRIGTTLALALALHVGFAFLVYRLVFRRLVALREAARRLERGELAAREMLTEEDTDEFQGVGDSMQRMAVDLQSQMLTIKQQMQHIDHLDGVLENELLTGKEVQDCLLTNLDEFPEWQPALFYLPLRKVSGDLYMMQRLPKGGAAVLLADAAGHGISASLITVQAAILAEIAFEYDPRPERVLSFLNQELGRRLPPYFYASAIVATIDYGGTICFANAGHAPGILYRASEDQVWWMEASDTPLGMNPDANYRPGEIKAQAGDRLLVYTDGLSEAEDAKSEPFAPERIVEVLRRHQQSSVAETLHALQDAWRNHSQQVVDDITILLLEIP